MSFRQAQYHPALRPEHRGNPLVEALSKKVADATVMEKLKNRVPYNSEERRLDAIEREEYVNRLDDWRLPIPEYIACFRMVEKALISSYGARNPFSPSTNHYLHYLDPNETSIQPRTGRMKTKGSAGTIVGVPGVGKSEMLDQVLNCIDQVLEHTDYNEKPLNLKQVLWVKVTCLDDMSLRGLCHSILGELDMALQRPLTKPAATIDALLTQIERQIRSNFVGLIAIDELQGLMSGRGADKSRLAKFLLNLIDRSGIAIILCGNEEILPVLSKKLWVSRRAEAFGFIDMKGLEPHIWRVFVKGLWWHQWTNIPTPLTDELNDTLYRLSTGIIDFAVKTYKIAQQLVIGSGDERITVETLEMAYQAACSLSKGGLAVRRQSADANLMEVVDDWPQQTMQQINAEAVEDNPTGKLAEQPKKIFGDLTRPHHPEFSSKLTELGNDPFLETRVHDADLVRRAGEGEHLLRYLEESGILMEDPIAELA